MKKTYKIIYLPLFYKDLNGIIEYITNVLNNRVAANNLLDTIEEEIQKRANGIAKYEKYKSNFKRTATYYRIYIKNYTIFYTIEKDCMEIRRIIYSKRNFNKLI